MNGDAPDPDAANRIARSDWSTADSPSEAVVHAVAAGTDVDPVELDPLQKYVDVDALDALVRSASDGLHVSFDYEDVGVFVASAGTVEVYDEPLDDE
ncbi:HalOD1 output domain-containing protein [Halobacterium yunchengense]|uniref:HalOD1 output domain-containing protein n=1 Tax=Halobacterium yunchengense TaxID=3108497 RepID=UPI0030089552